MIGVFISGICLLASPQGTLPPPTVLEAEQAVNPTTVTDHRPDFRARNPLAGNANRYQIQVTTGADAGFATPLWSSAAAPGGTGFGNVAPGAMSSEIPFGTTATLSTMQLDWGASYRWRIAMGSSGNISSWTSFSTVPATFTMASPTTNLNQHQINGSTSAPSWRFIGVPIAIGTTVPASELLDDVPVLYRLDEATRTWIQLNLGDVLQGGHGYLGWASPNTVLTLSQGKVMAGIPPVKAGNGRTTTPSYTFTNTFSRTTQPGPMGSEITDGVGANGYIGNHLFANPFYTRLSWRKSNVNPAPFGHVGRTNISALMYKWDGTQYLTFNGTSGAGTAGEWIEPFQAVGILILPGTSVLTIDFPATPLTGGPQKASPSLMAPALPASDPDRWHLMLEARSGAAIDTENAFGIDPEASNDWDERDSEDPGVGTTTWLNVHVDHRTGWGEYSRKYTHEFRQTPLKAGDVVTWTVTVDGNTGLPATLTWPNLSDIPADDWKLTLEDPATSTLVDLSGTASYDTAPVNGPSTLTLRATRLKDAPTAPSSGGGGGCGLLGLEALVVAGWMFARRRCKLS